MKPSVDMGEVFDVPVAYTQKLYVARIRLRLRGHGKQRGARNHVNCRSKCKRV